MTNERAMKNGHGSLSTLEHVLQWHGQFRRSLEPLRVTPLQAAMLLFVSRHTEAKLRNATSALCVRQPTLTEVVKDLVRKRWVTKRRSVVDTRVLHLRLSWRGAALSRQIEQRVHHVTITLAEEVRNSLGMTPQNRTDLRLLVP
jgi:DNA-binding MarR family transcriptional regulator